MFQQFYVPLRFNAFENCLKTPSVKFLDGHVHDLTYKLIAYIFFDRSKKFVTIYIDSKICCSNENVYIYFKSLGNLIRQRVCCRFLSVFMELLKLYILLVLLNSQRVTHNVQTCKVFV